MLWEIFHFLTYTRRRHSFLFIHSLGYLLSLASSLSYNTQFFVFILFFVYVYFCEFYEWRERERGGGKEKNVFIRRRDAKRLLTDKHQELFVRDIYWDIIFTSLILCFSILFSLLAFRLARLWHFFPDILNTAHIYIRLGLETLFSSFPSSSFNFRHLIALVVDVVVGKSGVISLSFLSLPLSFSLFFIFSTAFQDVMCTKGISHWNIWRWKHTEIFIFIASALSTLSTSFKDIWTWWWRHRIIKIVYNTHLSLSYRRRQRWA